MTEIILSNKKHGMLVLLLTIVLYILAVLGTIFFADEAQIAPLVLCILYLSLGWLPLLGLKVLGPQGSPGAHPVRQLYRHPEGRGVLLRQPLLHRGEPRRQDPAEPERRRGQRQRLPRSWPPWAGARSPCPRRLSPRRSP